MRYYSSLAYVQRSVLIKKWNNVSKTAITGKV